MASTNRLKCTASNIKKDHLQLLSKILNNIINCKNIKKYRDLNFRRTTTKLNNCQSCVQLLFDAGFDVRNGTRLIFDLNKLNKLKSIQALLLSQNSKLSNHAAIFELIQEGFGLAEAEMAIQMSLTNDFDNVKAAVKSKNETQPDYTISTATGNESNIECEYDVSVCSNRVIQLLQTHCDHNMNNNKDLLKINMTVLLNDFIHLLQKHTKNEEFDFIVAQLKHCDVKSCKVLRNINNINAPNISYRIDIFNKIHCYFHHMYDFGHKLTKKERSSFLSDHKSNNNDSIGKMCQILLKNRKKLTIKSNERYNQLSHNVYSFGELFSYGYVCEHSFVKIHDAIKVYAKYTSLKVELLANNLLIQRYNNEYHKATVHFNSWYCKQIEPYHQVFMLLDTFKADISLDHILSLMVYCNYDNFQKKFSQTYRDNVHEHDRFYHLGLYLKQSVHWFGRYTDNGNIFKFYHGVSKKMILQTCASDGNGVIINGPLSTSSSCEVAINFAGYNGLVLELNSNKNGFGKIHTLFEEMKYFPVSWLSDYPNERECLFIQNDQCLCIQNIIDVQFGVEYDKILCAINTIQQLTSTPMFLGNVSYEIQILMKVICHNQLSYALPEYKKFKSLFPYGEKLVRHYFEYKYEVVLDWLYCQLKCNALNFLLFSRFQWIKMDLLASLFPNLREFSIVNVNLCSETIKYILHFCKKGNRIKFRSIKIKPTELSAMSVSKVMSTYQHAFSAVGYQLTQKFKRFGKEVDSDWKLQWKGWLFIENDKIKCSVAETYAETNKKLTVSMQQTYNPRHINDLGKTLQKLMSVMSGIMEL